MEPTAFSVPSERYGQSWVNEIVKIANLIESVFRVSNYDVDTHLNLEYYIANWQHNRIYKDEGVTSHAFFLNETVY